MNLTGGDGDLEVQMRGVEGGVEGGIALARVTTRRRLVAWRVAAVSECRPSRPSMNCPAVTPLPRAAGIWARPAVRNKEGGGTVVNVAMLRLIPLVVLVLISGGIFVQRRKRGSLTVAAELGRGANCLIAMRSAVTAAAPLPHRALSVQVSSH